MKAKRFLAAVFVASALAPGAALRAEPSWTVRPRSVEISPGGIVEIRAAGQGLSAVQGRLGARAIPFFVDSFGRHSALVGVDLGQRPGALRLTVKGSTAAGIEQERAVALNVQKAAFAEEKFSVPAEFDRFTREVLDRIKKEQARLSALWTGATPERLWEGPFSAPLEGGVTSPFGLRRVINGAARSPHSGVDLKAPEGAAIAAPNHGRVAFCAELFFSGKSLVLDHGGGLYTMYFHLSEFAVKEGERVHRGGLIGRVGMTGRVTGPHLHWGAMLNGARVDPFELTGIAAAQP